MAPRKHSRALGLPRAGGYHVKTGCITCKYVALPLALILFEGTSYFIVPPLFRACDLPIL